MFSQRKQPLSLRTQHCVLLREHKSKGACYSSWLAFAIKVWKMENHAQKDPDNCCNQEEKKFFLYLRQSTSHHWNFSPWSQPIIFARVRITARMRLP